MAYRIVMPEWSSAQVIKIRAILNQMNHFSHLILWMMMVWDSTLQNLTFEAIYPMKFYTHTS